MLILRYSYNSEAAKFGATLEQNKKSSLLYTKLSSIVRAKFVVQFCMLL